MLAPRPPTTRHCALLNREQGILSNGRSNFYLPPTFLLSLLRNSAGKTDPITKEKKSPKPASEVLIAELQQHIWSSLFSLHPVSMLTIVSSSSPSAALWKQVSVMLTDAIFNKILPNFPQLHSVSVPYISITKY